MHTGRLFSHHITKKNISLQEPNICIFDWLISTNLTRDACAIHNKNSCHGEAILT